MAINQANGYIDGSLDFLASSASPVAPRFTNINLHNVLYVSSGLAYSDTDYTTQEQLFPDDVLIENSARTGNGKVKFSYIHGSATEVASAEQTFLANLKEAADTNAVQRVEVELGGGKTYQAVSSGAFNDTFDIKIPGLTATTNATIKTYYASSSTSSAQNITINMTEPNTYSSTACSDVSSDLTIDGDSLTSLTPAGDGFLPHRKSTGEICRVFRNKSSYARNLADFYQQKYGETQREKAARLRIQGGTGNCGSLAGASIGSARVASLAAFIPALLIFLPRKRRKK